MRKVTSVVVCAVLASVSIGCSSDITRRREDVLKDHLMVMRALIQQYTLDKQRAPTSLRELVKDGYLREIPMDITGSRETWVEVQEDGLLSVDETQPGIVDVCSGSDNVSSEGTRYSSW